MERVILWLNSASETFSVGHFVELCAETVTYVSGFAVEGLLRSCFQSADEEDWMAISISVTEREREGGRERERGREGEREKERGRETEGGTGRETECTGVHMCVLKNILDLTLNPAHSHSRALGERAHLVENSAVKCSKASPSFSLLSGTGSRKDETL